MPFVQDLKLGKKYENISLEYLKYDDIIFQPEKKFKEYDFGIIINKKKLYFESKCDRLAHNTGNLAIEFECNKKPSGITTTKAHYYMYHIINNNECYKIPTRILRKMIKNEEYHREVLGGDGWRSRMYLIKVTKFKKYKVTKFKKHKVAKFKKYKVKINH